MTERPCGSCSLCCKLMSIGRGAESDAGFYKPGGVWCHHCKPGKGGCMIYADRPTECRKFMCFHAMGMPALPTRPDKLRVLFAGTNESGTINCFVDPGYSDRLEHPEVKAFIRHATEKGLSVKIWDNPGDTGMRRMVIRGDRVLETIPEAERAEFIRNVPPGTLTPDYYFTLHLKHVGVTEDGGELTQLLDVKDVNRRPR
jgi:hypothetical protein